MLPTAQLILGQTLQLLFAQTCALLTLLLKTRLGHVCPHAPRGSLLTQQQEDVFQAALVGILERALTTSVPLFALLVSLEIPTLVHVMLSAQEDSLPTQQHVCAQAPVQVEALPTTVLIFAHQLALTTCMPIVQQTVVFATAQQHLLHFMVKTLLGAVLQPVPQGLPTTTQELVLTSVPLHFSQRLPLPLVLQTALLHL